MTELKSLRAIMEATKGEVAYLPGGAFVLHVFWEAPSLAAAQQLLGGLQQCAAATQRDTPCVPTYFFRVANSDAELCPPPPTTVGEHPKLCEARRKLDVGVPPQAVRTNLVKLGIDPALADAAPSTPLPAAMQTQPVRVEFTELYLDERAFMLHAGSRDYLDGYAVVMSPALVYRTPTTVRFGTPSATIVDGILDPILKAVAAPIVEGTSVWTPPPSTPAGSPHAAADTAIMLSVDVVGGAAALGTALSAALREACTTCLVFDHPLREGVARLLCVLPSLPPLAVLAGVAALGPVRGEAHVAVTSDAAWPGVAAAAVTATKEALSAAGLGIVTVNASEGVGYVLHPWARDLTPRRGSGEAH